MDTGQEGAHEAPTGGAGPPTESPVEGVPAVDPRALRRAQLAAIHERGTSTLATSAVVMLACALLLHGHVATDALLTWLCAGLAALAVRAPVAVRCRRLAAGDGPLPAALPLGLVFLTAAAYGSLALFWHPALPVTAQLVLILFPVAVTVGIVPSYANWLPMFFAFGAVALLPMLAVLLLSPEPSARLLAVPVLVFMVGETVVARRTSARMQESIRLRLGNEALVSRLTERAAELEAARDAARRASDAKDEFLARMSHELRTPLNGVLGMSQLLAGGALDAEQRRRLETLEDSGRALLGLVDGLLDVARLRADELRLRPRPVRLAESLERVAAAYRARAGEVGLGFELAVDPGVPTWASLDPLRFEQVLTHLVDNAVKFTDRGSVSVRVASAAHDRLLLVVEDTGIGMAPELAASMFELFVQGDGTGSRRHGGTGLGLAIARDLVALMGGAIETTSSPGGGTRVVVELPLVPAVAPGNERSAPAVAGASPAPAPEVRAGARGVPQDHRSVGERGARVLVAEDNEVNRLVIEAMLRDLDCEVELVHDGAQALAALERYRPDLVLMDCQMPVVDGFEATRRLRAGGHDVPVIAVTANALEGDRERCLAAGMDDYLTKPLDRERLAATLELWGRRRAPAARAA